MWPFRKHEEDRDDANYDIIEKLAEDMSDLSEKYGVALEAEVDGVHITTF